ncbi:MAG: hypothetical protein HYR55_13670 [Acidobacteria bacterium]|nr:hypothetical protein [Acidobacteriota bacterium]MBI3656630.1 hypothetical protein [Acidobacteriota bacterium]
MKKESLTGRAIDSYCTACESMRPHTIMTMRGENVLKVTCQTCAGTHKFLAAKPLGKAEQAKAREAAAATRRAEMRKASFDEALAQLNTNKAREYNLAEGGYKINDLIKHNVFGYGIVDEVEGRSKMIVRFREGSRRLVFNYPV